MKFELPEVVAIPNLGYAVRSASVAGAMRIVHGNECTCPAGQKGARTCRHRRAVDEFVRSHSDDYRRPQAKQNVEFFV